MTVYLDLIFLTNFLIDTILLWSTAFVLKLKPRWYRLGLGAAIGATYTLVIFFPYINGLFTFFTKLLFSALMVFCTFGYHRIGAFLQRILCFYMVAFVLGGGLLGLHFFLQTESEILSGIVFTQTGGLGTSITWGFILIAFPCLWWLSGRALRQLKENNRKATFYVELEVFINEQAIACRGLIDTGNQLYEPITRWPVTIMDLNLFKEVLPEKLYATVKDKKDLSSHDIFPDVEDDWLQKVRIIPYRSVSRGMDLLLALRPDKVRLIQDGEIYETKRVLIGLNPVPLSSDGSYQAIVHPQFIDGGTRISDKEGDFSKQAM
ncbi:sigma-E processing peptidase SpoIIGA [Ammoniphilus sp. CFH 90114]|uniref:sigma-E processing peptidase SpoIIGA n=1 Tax=Ammoniphilus sp. CFH 90114 TaxID=2493665 RepID=UPI00100FD296|nr:sigma-E processing peptidase SpoIIGA [Ammoniphilus sp. CFH 90114]RXT15015.1 sigma-E processing peptidase SpoIIGA [Ammoniphilus sp. CFH 90114]